MIKTERLQNELNLRDYFAVRCLAGLLADSKYMEMPAQAALDAYAFADALMAERAK